VKAQYSQTYTFTTLSDDGVRLWVNDKLIVNNWSDHAQTENNGTIALQAGVMYPIKMEFYENLLSAVAKLSWSSASQAKQIIPSSQLFTGNSSTPSGCAEAKENNTATLSCPNGQSINAIKFASYGTPTGSCPNFAASSCHASSSKGKVEAACLNKQSCSVGANNGVFGDPCVGTYKKLAVTYSCSGGSTDQCPNDPNKTSPGICGCGVADTDTDKDGTADCKDGCKNDPKKTAPGQCGCGVAEDTCNGFKGRIAISSDGNEHDADDWGATALSLAILARAGLQDKLVHYDYSNHIWGDNQNGPAQMTESALGGATRFGFHSNGFFDDRKALAASVAHITQLVNSSTAENPLYFIIAGPMEVAWRGLNAADDARVRNVVCISHSTWNDNHAKDHGGHSYNDLLALGCGNGHINDQNGGFKTGNMSAWDWLKSTNNGDWLWSRINAVNAIGGSSVGDASDAGMVYYLVTGDKYGNVAKLHNWWE
jgi:hypothetical protein